LREAKNGTLDERPAKLSMYLAQGVLIVLTDAASIAER
jgi:hypothetical protein